LPDAADAERIGRRIADRARIDRATTIGAESMRAFVPALRGLDVNLRRPAVQYEGLGRSRNIDPIGRACKRLAIRANELCRLGRLRYEK
jgi:hypothetical protein